MEKEKKMPIRTLVWIWEKKLDFLGVLFIFLVVLGYGYAVFDILNPNILNLEGIYTFQIHQESEYSLSSGVYDLSFSSVNGHFLILLNGESLDANGEDYPYLAERSVEGSAYIILTSLSARTDDLYNNKEVYVTVKPLDSGYNLKSDFNGFMKLVYSLGLTVVMLGVEAFIVYLFWVDKPY